MSQGMLSNIQHFSLHDGPGIRSTVFFKGCNLRCWWCHNPESREFGPTMQFISSKCIGCGACAQACPEAADGKSAILTERCRCCGACAQVCYAEALVSTGRVWSADQVLDELLRDEAVYRRSGGGVTFSGGEPLLQPELLIELAQTLHERGIHTAVETALCVPEETVRRLLPWISLFFCDVKCADPSLHREHTGADNRQTLGNIRFLSQAGASILLRTPVVPGFNDREEELSAIGAFAASLPSKPALELLPFHGVCAGKYTSMGLPWRGAGLSTPTRERMDALAAAAAAQGVQVTHK